MEINSLEDNKQEILELVYPVGSIYISTVEVNPNTLFGFGTWERFAENRMLLGISSNPTEMADAESTGGVPVNTLNWSHMPYLSIKVPYIGQTYDAYQWLYSTSYQGGYERWIYDKNVDANYLEGQPNAEWGRKSSLMQLNLGNRFPTALDNMPPYINVYIWKRTS